MAEQKTIKAGAGEGVGRRTNPAGFVNPHSVKNRLGRLAWSWVYVLLFRFTPPRRMGGWRTWLLRRFGARIEGAWFHPSVRIWAPWELEVGKDVWVDEGTNLYNAFGLRIGDRVVISQGCFLCSATHDYTVPEYPLVGKPIVVEKDTWITAQVFIGPGVTVHEGAVVGARAVVVKDVEAWTVVAGNPAKKVKDRKLS